MYLRRLRDLGAGERVPNYVYVIIEVPLDSEVEYVYDEDLDVIRVEKVLSPGARYPFNKGFIPGTLDESERTLNAIVISSRSFLPGSLIETKPIGGLRIFNKETSEYRYLVVTVPRERIDPVYAGIKNLNDLSKDLRESIRVFIENYMEGDHKESLIIDRWEEAQEARERILESVKRALSARTQRP